MGVLSACVASGGTGDGDLGRSEPLPVELLADRHGDAVWRVETEGCGWTGVGSAFAVDERHLVTNHHVIAHDPAPQLRSRRGEVRQGRVIGGDRRLDVAVIELDERLGGALAWAPTSSLQLHERLVVLGYPRPDHAFTVSYGSLLQAAGVGDVVDALLSDAPVDRGSSGGPALRGDGTVAGVVTRAVLDDPGEHVTIVHASDRVADAVAAAIAAPDPPEPECELGPDYAPPAPPELDVAVPPPPPEPPVVLPDPGPTTAAPATTTTAVTSVPAAPTWTDPPASGPDPTACPSGTVAAEAEVVGPAGDEVQPLVAVQGTIANHGPQGIVVTSLTVLLPGAAEPVPVTAPSVLIAPGEVRTWEAAVPAPPGDPLPGPPQVRVQARWGSAAGCHGPVQLP